MSGAVGVGKGGKGEFRQGSSSVMLVILRAFEEGIHSGAVSVIV